MIFSPQNFLILKKVYESNISVTQIPYTLGLQKLSSIMLLLENTIFSYHCSNHFIESRYYILHECRSFNNYWNLRRDTISHFMSFLEFNSNIFSFGESTTQDCDFCLICSSDFFILIFFLFFFFFFFLFFLFIVCFYIIQLQSSYYNLPMCPI